MNSSVENVLDAILQQAQAGIGSLMLLDDRASCLRIVAARGFPADTIEQVKKMTLAPGEGIAGHVYQTGKPYFLNDAVQDNQFVHWGLPMRLQSQFLSLPLAGGKGRTVGVLNIHFPNGKILNSSELEELHQTANKLLSVEISTAEPQTVH